MMSSACGPGPVGEGAKFWLAVLTDLSNRGVADVFFPVCDDLKGTTRRGERRVTVDHRADLIRPP